jgi:hypothetical protein
MKTTIDIPDSLLRQAKKLAAERNTTLKSLIETALREVLAGTSRPRKRFRLDTRTFGGRGLQPGLEWDEWGTIRSMIYEGRGG